MMLKRRVKQLEQQAQGDARIVIRWEDDPAELKPGDVVITLSWGDDDDKPPSGGILSNEKDIKT